MPLDTTSGNPAIAQAAGATGPGLPQPNIAALSLPGLSGASAPIAQAGGTPAPAPGLPVPAVPAAGTLSPPVGDQTPLSSVLQSGGTDALVNRIIAREGHSPLGVQNNPGNIKFVGAPGQTDSGVRATDGGTFASYATPQAGRDAIVNLIKTAAVGGSPAYGASPTVGSFMATYGGHAGGGVGGGGSAYDQRRTDIYAQEQDINKKIGDIADKIGALDARDPESLRELRHYREEMEKYQQQALQIATHPPQFSPGQTMQQQGGMALVIGLLGGLLTKRPLIASLNAGAAALNAYNKGDQEAYQREMDKWKVSTDAMFKMAEFEHQMYSDTLKDEQLTEGQKLDKLKAQAQMMGNQRMILASQSHDLDAVQAHSDSMTLRLAQFQQSQARAEQLADKPQLFVDPKTQRVLEFHPGSDTTTEAPLPEGATKLGTSGQAAPDEKAVDSTAKLIADYKMAPLTGWTLRGKFGQEVMAKVAELNPDYDATRYAAKVRAEVAFTTGRQGDAVRSFSVAIDHLNVAQELGQALANNDVRSLNRLKNVAQTEFGYEGPIDFNFAKSIVGDEVAKAVIGGVGSLTDRQELQSGFNAASSPEQLAGIISTAKRLMAGQLSGYRRQAGTAGFSADQFEGALSPAAKQELERLGAGSSTGSASSGKPPIIQNGNKFDPDTHQYLGPVTQ